MILATLNALVYFTKRKPRHYSGSVTFTSHEDIFNQVFASIFSDEFDSIPVEEIENIYVSMDDFDESEFSYALTNLPANIDYFHKANYKVNLVILLSDKEETQYSTNFDLERINLLEVFSHCHQNFYKLLQTNKLSVIWAQFKEIQLRIEGRINSNCNLDCI